MATESTITNIANELERVPERVADARKAFDDWRGALIDAVKARPTQTLLGAFVVGYVFAKIGRYI
jgi:hypothetical protein